MKIRPMVNGTGAAQQTMPAQMILATLNRGTGTARRRSRRRPSRAVPAARRRKARATARRPARLVKGSAAAKRYMASIRRKRRR